MTDLEVLNVVMEKLGHGKTVPMRLNINVNGVAREIEVDRGHSKIQDLIHLLVIEMLKEEMSRVKKGVKVSEKLLEPIPGEVEEAPTKYDVKVQMDPIYAMDITILAWSARDARMMAYILTHPECPIRGVPEEVAKLAMAATEIVE